MKTKLIKFSGLDATKNYSILFVSNIPRGVNIANLDWRPHINKGVTKANKVLRFLKRNAWKAPEEVNKTEYKTMVRCKVEYCGAIWDPYTADLSSWVERI